MNRKSLITAISLPRETDSLLQNLQTKFHKSRSELLREMITFYVDSSKNRPGKKSESDYIDDSDANKVLKLYYKLISETKPKPTLIVGVGIINKGDKVLIGLRKSTDQHVKDLHWTFPSTKFISLEFEKEVTTCIKREAGFQTKVGKLIHARVFPDSPAKSVRIVTLYYAGKIIDGKAKAGGDFKELKWVPAAEVNRYFTTSVSDEVMNYLGSL